MGTDLTFSKPIPVRHDVDVFVAGGGPAGVAAALAAVRQGRSVFVAENQNCFGGMGTVGMLPIFMSFGDGVTFMADGIGREIFDRLWKAGGMGEGNKQSDMAPRIKCEVLKRVYDEMLLESGAEFSFQTAVVDVKAEAGRVTHVICAGKSGMFAVKASMVVDCTGDGDVAAWAGAPFEKGDEKGRMMPGTLCSLWANVDWETVWGAGLSQERELHKAMQAGEVNINDPHLPGMFRTEAGLAGGNVGHSFGVDGTDERSLTKAVIHGRAILPEYEKFYKKYLKGYENMALAATASYFGVRETRRIMGDYVLDADDYMARATFPDEIGRYNYWVDIHPLEPDPEEFSKHIGYRDDPKDKLGRYQEGESYGIPYRTLTPKGLDNVLVAGRCVSCDTVVQSSIRVMPGCFITGQAAGLAAAMAVDGNCTTREIDVTSLQASLKDMGGYLPNA